MIELDTRKVEQLMAKRLWTQEVLAKKSKISAASLSYWLNGIRKPRPQSIKKLARGFGVAPQELVK